MGTCTVGKCPVGMKTSLEDLRMYLKRYKLCPISYITRTHSCRKCGKEYRNKPRNHTFCGNRWVVCGRCFYDGYCLIHDSVPELPEAKKGCLKWSTVNLEGV